MSKGGSDRGTHEGMRSVKSASEEGSTEEDARDRQTHAHTHLTALDGADYADDVHGDGDDQAEDQQADGNDLRVDAKDDRIDAHFVDANDDDVGQEDGEDAVHEELERRDPYDAITKLETHAAPERDMQMPTKTDPGQHERVIIQPMIVGHTCLAFCDSDSCSRIITVKGGGVRS